MHIALIGATGFVGTALLNELLQRGHRVTALARDPAKLPLREGLTVVQANATDAAQVAQAVRGVDAVASAYNPGWTHPDLHDEFLRGSRAITAGVKAAGVQRLLVVGGAGSLYVAPGVQLVDTPQVPAEWKNGALAAREALNLLRTEVLQGRNGDAFGIVFDAVHRVASGRVGDAAVSRIDVISLVDLQLERAVGLPASAHDGVAGGEHGVVDLVGESG